MKCKQHNVEMVEGIAIKHTQESSCRYFVPYDTIRANTLQIIRCLKCPICGYSDDGKGYETKIDV